ncbi:MAG: carbon starvation protein A [Planctomycetes bacterium]|nr:carbon starvation protein A [Planctomycetota bacterium]
MNVAVMVLISLIVSAFGYFVYARMVARWLGVDPNRKTPSHTMTDGIDYVPARAPVLFGHHFASIAGAGPILGPVIAAAYGWLPAFLWILVGVVFLGAMFDFSVIIASVRHEGKSIGEIIEDNIGDLGKRLFLLFSWSALILVIAAFTNVVAKTFASHPSVATASVLFIGIAIVFGFFVYRRNVPLSVATIIGVLCVAGCVYVGHKGWAQIQLTRDQWIVPILIYIFIASCAPVWILLQPRDYLNSFLLYAMLLGALVGVFVARPDCVMPALITFDHATLGPIFPILFVTVACGAISGFHSLVGSGTTSKQLNSEADARPIGYGAMLIEGVLAVLALGSVAILTAQGYTEAMEQKGAILVFAEGIAASMKAIGISTPTGVSLITLAVSCFALTTLDTGTRLGRYAFQEFFESKNDKRKSILARNRYIGTAITVILSGILAEKGIGAIWPIFGAANQLLGALGLLAVSAWLARRKRQNLFTVIPMVFMFTITLSALGLLIYHRMNSREYGLATVAAFLFLLAIVLTVSSLKHLAIRASTAEQSEDDQGSVSTKAST